MKSKGLYGWLESESTGLLAALQRGRGHGTVRQCVGRILRMDKWAETPQLDIRVFNKL